MTLRKPGTLVAGGFALLLVTSLSSTAAADQPRDINTEGVPWSAVDVTMGIGPVPKTVPSASDKNAAGIPLSALDQVLGLHG
jgi:hypothetical protein